VREPALLRLLEEDDAAERLLERDGAALLRLGGALLRAAAAGRDVDELLLRAGAEGAERVAGAAGREDGATLRLLLAGAADREPADEEPVVVEGVKLRGTATDDEDDGDD